MRRDSSNLHIAISDTTSRPAPETTTAVPATPLSKERYDALLARVPNREEANEGEREDTPLCVQSQPPTPLSPTTWDLSDSKEVPPPTSRFSVVSCTPQGDVGIAVSLSLSFSQDVIKLGDDSSVEQYVAISPSTEGTWDWLSPRLLSFVPVAERFAMATDYTVTVSGQIRSADGQVLGDDQSFAFQTPAVKVEKFQAFPKHRVLCLTMNQEVGLDDLLPHLICAFSGEKHRSSFREATVDEISRDGDLKKLAEGDLCVALVPTVELPPKSAVNVVVDPRIRSIEGPRLSQKRQSFQFKTPARFNFISCQRCDYMMDSFVIEISFNGDVDETSISPETIEVNPPLDNLKYEVHGSDIFVQGVAQSNQDYRVKISTEITSVYGEKLLAPVTRKLKPIATPQYLSANQDSFAIVNPDAPVFPYLSRGHKELRVRVFAVTVDDWTDWAICKSQDKKYARLPGTLLSDECIQVKERDSETAGTVKLNQFTPKHQHFIVWISVVGQKDKDNYRSRPVVAWVQVTSLSALVLADQGRLLVWVGSMRDATPIPDATVRFLEREIQAKTDLKGIALIDLPEKGSKPAKSLLIETATEHLFLPKNTTWNGVWRRQLEVDELRWFVQTDRGVYRPGDDLYIKGWVRIQRVGRDGQVELLDKDRVLKYKLAHCHEEILAGKSKVSSDTGFGFSIRLPKDMPTGNMAIGLECGGASFRSSSHCIQILVEEYREPEFTVSLSSEVDASVAGEPVVVTADANYFSGGPLADATVDWRVLSEAVAFAPEGYEDYCFGEDLPDRFWEYQIGELQAKHTGCTDEHGRHAISIVPEIEDGYSRKLRVQAETVDINRQAMTGETTITLHPGEFYVGLNAGSRFALPGESLAVKPIVLDWDGQPVTGQRITLSAFHQNYDASTNQRVDDSEPCWTTVELSCTSSKVILDALPCGRYCLVAEVQDATGRVSRSRLDFWQLGSGYRFFQFGNGPEVKIFADREAYAYGDTARITVQSPFDNAQGLLVFVHGAIQHFERFSVCDGTFTTELSIDERYIPALEVHAFVSNGTHAASAELSISTTTAHRQLAVEVTPSTSTAKPADLMSVGVIVRDAGCTPTAANLAVMVVDQAVLSLAPNEVGDPLDAIFHKKRWVLDSVDTSSLGSSRTEEYACRAIVADCGDRLCKDDGLYAYMGMPGAGVLGDFCCEESEPDSPIYLRENFATTPLFLSTLETDGDGLASFEFELPDNLTEFRILVLAASGADQFGVGEATVNTRLPFMLRPALPRFLHVSDLCEISVVLQSLCDQALSIDVAFETTNLETEEVPGRALQLLAHSRTEIRIPAQAGVPGNADVLCVAAGSGRSDAVKRSFPIEEPAAVENRALYGQMKEDVVQHMIHLPESASSERSQLDLQVSTSALTSLSDCIRYLVRYPYDCSEQRASRILANCASKAFQQASPLHFEGLGPPDHRIEKDMKGLAEVQKKNGGFPFWPGPQVSVYLSIFIPHALAEAKQRGLDVPSEVLDRSSKYLGRMDYRMSKEFNSETSTCLRCYGAYVMQRLGKTSTSQIDSIRANATELPTEALGWLLLTLTEGKCEPDERMDVVHSIEQRAIEHAGRVEFRTRIDEDGKRYLLQSQKRVDAIILLALLQHDPEHRLVPKVVTSLMASQVNGHWLNTQENIFVLLALSRYFELFDSEGTDLDISCWCNESLILQEHLTGVLAQKATRSLPLGSLDRPIESITLEKKGRGRPFYRAGLQLQQRDPYVKSLDSGFSVTRTYTHVDDDADVLKEQDGWYIHAGSLVRVRLAISCNSNRYHVAVVDSLPAGFECVNPVLEMSRQEKTEVTTTGSHWWRRPWFDHQELRDTEARAFAEELKPGTYIYEYIARATTIGSFIAPAPRVEEMYAPETFGRGEAEHIRINEKPD